MAELTQSSVVHFSRAEIVSILFGLILAMFLASLDQTIVATSLSTMAQDLNGWALISWVVSAYLVASTVTTPIYGKLSDLYGRRPILSVAITLFLGASVLCALSQNMPQLIGARVLQGVGGGGLRSVALAAIADIIPPRERGRYQGYFSSTMAISNVLGPVLGGFFSEYLTWHWIFWINLPFGLLALLLCWRNLRRLPKPRRRPIIDWLGAALILASTTPILIGLGQAEAAAGWGRSEVLVPLAIGAAFLAVLIYREREAPEPIIPLRLFANRIFAVACLISLSMSMVMIAMIILVPLDFELGAGLAPNDAGLRGHRAWRGGGPHGRGAIAEVGLGRSWPLDTFLTALLGFSFGAQLPSVMVPVQNALDLPDTGVGLSVVMFFRLIGGAFGVALLTALLVGDLNAGALALPGHDVLVPHPGIALLHLDKQDSVNPALMTGLQHAVRNAFSRVYLWAAAISGLTLTASFGLKEIPLRGA